MNKTNLFLDFGILAAFLLAIEPMLTGISLHEWLSVVFAAAIIIHLLLHWRWITSVGTSFFKKLFHTSRLKFFVDSLLFVSFTTIMFSGFMISRAVLPFLGIEVGMNRAWEMLHRLSANTTLALVGLHFALNWKWVVAITRRYVFAPVTGLFRQSPTPEPVMVEVRKDYPG